VRLAVVAILSLIGTSATGFFGMNLLDETQAPLVERAFYFGLVTALASRLSSTQLQYQACSPISSALLRASVSLGVKNRAFSAVWARR
jgi:hypothetical protein